MDKSILGRRNAMCKHPEAREQLALFMEWRNHHFYILLVYSPKSYCSAEYIIGAQEKHA